LSEAQHRQDHSLAGKGIVGKGIDGVFVSEECDGDEEIHEHEETVVVVEGQEGHCYQSGN